MNQTAIPVTNPDLTVQIQQLNLLLSQLLQGASHLVTGGMAAHAFQWLKTRHWIADKWATYTDTRKTVYGALAAALPASGIVFSFNRLGPGHFTIDVDHLTIITAGLFLWSFVQNWLWQQAWYMKVIRAQPITGVAPSNGHSSAALPPVPVVVTPVGG